MENVTQFWGDAMANASGAVNGFLAYVQPWQLLLAASILLVLAIILICVASARGRRCDELTEAQESAQQETRRAQDEGRRMVEAKEKEMRRVLDQKQEEMLKALAEKEKRLTESREEARQLRKTWRNSPRFGMNTSNSQRQGGGHPHHPGGQDHAYVVNNRTEMGTPKSSEHQSGRRNPSAPWPSSGWPAPTRR